MRALFLVIDLALQLYIWIVIAMAIFSWLVAFNVVNTRNHVVAMIGDFLYRITEPALRPIRNITAQSRRHRYFAGHLVPDHRLHPLCDRALYPAQRLLNAVNARPWTQAADGVAPDARVTPRASREAIEGIERRARWRWNG